MPENETFDPEVADFVESLPRELGYAELAARIAQRFGAERSWPAEKVRRFWVARHRRRHGVDSSIIDNNPDIRAFVLDRAHRLKLDVILAQARAAFGDRAPSRTTIHRFVQKL